MNINSERIRICSELWEKNTIIKRYYVWIDPQGSLTEIQQQMSHKFGVDDDHYLILTKKHLCSIESRKSEIRRLTDVITSSGLQNDERLSLKYPSSSQNYDPHKRSNIPVIASQRSHNNNRNNDDSRKEDHEENSQQNNGDVKDDWDEQGSTNNRDDERNTSDEDNNYNEGNSNHNDDHDEYNSDEEEESR